MVPGHRVRDFSDELEGYSYLPRMFDKARARLTGDRDGPQFGCPLDHSSMARLRVYPDDILELVRLHGDDDHAILSDLKKRGIPSAEASWFDADALEHEELLNGVYLQVRPRERVDELDIRAGDEVFAVDAGEALVSLGERSKRIVRRGEVVRIPPDLPHSIESVGAEPLVTS